MLGCAQWGSLIGFVIINIPIADCRVGYTSSKENIIPVTKVTCNRTNGEEYVCSYGHCCEDGCCSYYYELWWFWLIWSLVILLSCCCFYHQRQKHLAQRSRRRRPRRCKDRYEGVCNYPGPPLENKVMGSCKLPVYKDVIRMPPTSSPPPPYSSRRRSIHTIACVQANERGETSMSIIPCNVTSSMLSLASLSHYIPDILANNSIPFKPLSSCHGEAVDDNNNNPVPAAVGKQYEATYKNPVLQEVCSSPSLPPKLELKREQSNEPTCREKMQKWSSSESFQEVNNNPKSSSIDPHIKYGDGLPQYDDTSHQFLNRNDEQGELLGGRSNGDVVLNLSP